MGQKRRHEARQQREPLHENGRRRWQRQEVLDQKSEALTLEAVERIAQLREAKASNRRSAPSSSRRPATPERRDTGVVGLAKGMPQEMLRGAGMERLWSRAVATGGNRWQMRRLEERLKIADAPGISSVRRAPARSAMKRWSSGAQ
jgi:hypothetical protein